MTKSLCINLFRQLISFPKQYSLTLPNFLLSHFLSFSCENFYHFLSGNVRRTISFDITQNWESISDMIFADTIDRPIVNKKFQEHIQIQFAQCLFVVVYIFWKSDLILHVLNLFLSRIETHASHHIRYSLKGNFSI